MASTHTKAAVAGALGHSGSPEVQYQVRGRNTGGKLHRAGAKKKVSEETPIMASKAVVVHAEKIEAELEARIVAALERANTMIEIDVAWKAAVREQDLVYTPFVSGAETTRARLVAAGVIS